MLDCSDLPEMLTTKQVVERWGVPYKTVIGWCYTSKVAAVQLGEGGSWLIVRDSLLELLRMNDAYQRRQCQRRPKGVPGPSRQRAADRVLEGV